LALSHCCAGHTLKGQECSQFTFYFVQYLENFRGGVQSLGDGEPTLIVLPKSGLPDVDKEFYLMEGDFCTEPSADDPKGHVYSQERVTNENPSYVVTNGRVGALTGDNVLKVKVEEKVRFYYGQANDESWIHIIGGHFDKFYITGSFHPDSDEEYGVETTAVPAGSVTVAEYTFKYPGLYLLVNHKLIRATEKGQAVQIIVEGEENLDIMTVIEAPTAVR
jgi:nitrite reductase (NO-forming)